MLINVIFLVLFILCFFSELYKYRKGNQKALLWVGVDAAMIVWVISDIVKAL